MRRYRLLVLPALALSIAAVAAGCGGGGSATTTHAAGVTAPATPGQAKSSVYNDPSAFVLVEADVPDGYEVDRENTRAVTNADASRGRDDAYKRTLESFGRIGGYASGWRPGASSGVSGPLQIESSASTFESVGGATDAFALGVKEVGTKFTKVELKKGIGDEARMWKTEVAGINGPLTLFTVAWRTGRVLSTMAVASEQGRVAADVATEYANKAQARVEAAAARELGK